MDLLIIVTCAWIICKKSQRLNTLIYDQGSLQNHLKLKESLLDYNKFCEQLWQLPYLFLIVHEESE